MEFLFYVSKNEGFDFDFTQLGYSAEEEIPVHDIWQKEDIGTYTGSMNVVIPSHGAKLYRLGNKKATGIDCIKSEESSHSTMQKAQPNGCYNLQGQKVTSPASPGIYIINGSKVVVK